MSQRQPPRVRCKFCGQWTSGELHHGETSVFCKCGRQIGAPETDITDAIAKHDSPVVEQGMIRCAACEATLSSIEWDSTRVSVQ